jgi:hypothetical protein
MNGGAGEFVRMPFALISRIDPSDTTTWENRVFLTLDVDWASDDVFAHAIDLVDSLGARATWFITHDTPLLDRLRNSDRYEIGIHPNFNPLLFKGDTSLGSTPEEIVSRLLALVPGAKSVRSHSMTQSSWLLNLFRRLGLTHDCNSFVPVESSIALKPWRGWEGLVRVPYFWEDDLHAIGGEPWDVTATTRHRGLKVYDFHPIHLFLNTPTPGHYETARPLLSDLGRLQAMRHTGPGPRTFLEELVRTAGGSA